MVSPKLQFKMTEARLQQECYIWFHNTYPNLRGLYFKIKNEGNSGINANFILERIYFILKNPSNFKIKLNEIIEHCKHSGAISGAKDKATGLIPGVADNCLLLPNGKGPVFFEFKTDIGKQSETQKDWQLLATSHNYLYFIVRSLPQFQSICQELGL